uniref:dipeptidyl-peptidase III n=1 Tax=Strigamia maritima TaxID=126957 RepID=T1IIF5_STRMM
MRYFLSQLIGPVQRIIRSSSLPKISKSVPCVDQSRHLGTGICNVSAGTNLSPLTMSNIRNLTMPLDRSLFMFPNDQPVVLLDCQQAYENLTDKEKLYAHHLSQAAWKGGLIVLVQTSTESPLIFSLLMKLFRSQPLAGLEKIAVEKCGISKDEFLSFLVYASGLFTNMGNYKGFGDTKFIPNISKEKLENLILSSEAYKKDPKTMEMLWSNCSNGIFSLTDHLKQLGLNRNGITTYFSANCTEEDTNFINKFFKKQNIEAYNTRLFKTTEEKGQKYEIRLASAVSTSDDEEKSIVGTHEFDGQKILITRGDYASLLKLVNDELLQAKTYASNETEIKMLEKYVESFRTGSLDAHKDGSRFWINDKGPIVESDPAGQRGEFEGFVSMVNKEMSSKFAKLVAHAEDFLPLLPWPKEFEKDKFLRPDFTSLDVLTFAGSGIPAGINIPNYDCIRQTEGFKNVSLGNVIPASYKEKPPFLSSEDQELLQKYRVKAFELQVGLHELLGHGSGKLFVRHTDGSYNFDEKAVVDPLTGEKIKSWYEEGDTYDSVFTTMGSSYEECRAEAVGLHLCLQPKVLEIFGFEKQEAEDIIYINWLNLLLGALRGLEMFQPDKKTWGQAHSQARYVILQVLLEAGEGLVNVTQTTGSDGKPDLLLTLDRSKIATVGKDAIGMFLQKLQVYKTMAAIKQASEMFLNYSAVLEDSKIPFYKYRDIIVARRQPRKMFVQANTFVKEGKATLKTYEATHEGLIQSWVDRFPTEEIILDMRNEVVHKIDASDGGNEWLTRNAKKQKNMPVVDKLITELRRECKFLGVKVLADDLVDKICQLCLENRITAEDFVGSWVAFVSTKGLSSSEPTLELLDQLNKDQGLRKQNNDKAKQEVSHFDAKDDEVMDLGEDNDELLEAYGTPIMKAQASKRQITPDLSINKRRLGQKKLLCFFLRIVILPKSLTHPVINVNWENNRTELPVIVHAYDEASTLTKKYRYLYEKLPEKAEIHNQWLEDMGLQLHKIHDISFASPADIRIAMKHTILGRVWSDGLGKLNVNQLIIETPLHEGKSSRISLDVSKIPKFSFFPGQLIAIEGVNSQEKFIAEKIYDGISLPFSQFTPSNKESQEPLQIVVAAGPYTTADESTYNALVDLLNYLEKHQPHACVFIGPFVDSKSNVLSKHFEMQDSELCSYDDVFQSLMKMISSKIDSSKTQLIIVPSLRDLHHAHFVYPTAPFSHPELKGVHFMPDPCVLDINGVAIGITSVDILFHLGKDELSSVGSTDRLGRLASHVLKQQSFYPLCPPHEDVNIDYQHLDLHGGLPVTPDILILPSDLKYFIKNLDGCCCINPERLVKGICGGTFARIQVEAHARNPSSSIIESIAAQIIKI